MRKTSLFGLASISFITLLVFGCGGGYGGGGYGGGGNYGNGGMGGGGGTGIITSISISPANAGVSVGGSQQFTAVAKDSSGKTVMNPALTWKSSDTSVATVDSNGLANAVSVGTAGITASSTYIGTVYTSNTATLTVTLVDAVTGTAATGHALAGALVTLQDATGRSQSTVTDRNGRFQLSTAGLKPPFLLKAEDGRGRTLFGAAAKDGVANIDTATDLMLRAWYGSRDTSPEAAFAAHAGAPDVKSLAALDAGFARFMQDDLAAFDLGTDSFDLMTTSFLADSTGFDAVLDGMSVTPARGGLHLELRGRGSDILFEHGALRFSTPVADGQAMSVKRLELP
jgi:hypothetical protein